MTTCRGGLRWRLVHFLLLLLLLLNASPGDAQAQAQAGNASVDLAAIRQDYPDCGKSTYYANLAKDSSGNPDYQAWTKDVLGNLLTQSHRNVLTVDGIAAALIELDVAPSGGGVQLIYSGEVFRATLENFGEVDGWNQEHLWPDSRGAVGRYAFTDVHNGRPESTRTVMIRRSMLYGECGTVEYADVCETPAFGGGVALDTSQDGKVWMPPATVRGDVARALMYMELRYRKSDLNLTLTDCPPFNGKMGILSQLLEWHAGDPVSNEELARNQQACQYWQGNRNPFVDFPDLAPQFFGMPQEIQPGTRTYPSCLNIPTPAPTAEANECAKLAPGDIFIYVVETDDPDGVGFMALENIPGGLELYMTDNPWIGYDFVGNEGVVKMVVPDGGIAAGKQFGFGFDFGATQKWLREDGIFNIGTAGDSVFLYCYFGDSTVNPLVGFSNNNAWAPPDLPPADYGSERSALPPQLATVGSVILPHLDNYRYEGPEIGAKEDLQKYMMDPNNWKGTDQGLGDQKGSAAPFPAGIPVLAAVLLLAIAHQGQL